MSGSSYSFRIQADGFNEVVADFQRLGASGEAGLAAMEKLRNASPQLAVALTRAETTAAATATQLTTMGQSADRLGNQVGQFGTLMGQAGGHMKTFASEVIQGQNAVTSFAGQFAAFTAGFGFLGAIAGAAVTAVANYAVSVYQASGNTNGLTTAIQAQNDAFRDQTEAARAAREGLAQQSEGLLQLSTYYRTATADLRAFQEAQAGQRRAALTTERGALDERLYRGSTIETARTGRRESPVFTPAGDFTGFTEEVAVQVSNATRRVAEAFQEFRSQTVATAEDVAKLHAALLAAANGAGNQEAAIRALAASVAAAAPEYARLAEAQQRAAAEAIALRIAAGDSQEQLRAMAASLGAVGEAALTAARNLQLTREGAVGLAAAESQVRVMRDSAVLNAIAVGGRDAGVRVSESQERDARISTRESQLRTRALQEYTAATGNATAAAELLNAQGTRYRDLATSEVDAARRRTTGLQETAGAARGAATDIGLLADAYTELRRTSAGIDSQGPIDDAFASRIQQQTRGTRQTIDRERQDAEKREQDSRREQERQTERQQQASDRFAERWGDRLADATTQGLFDGFTKGQSIFTTLSRTFTNVLRQAVSSGLSQMVFQPLLGGSGGSGGTTGSSSLFSGLGNLFGGSGGTGSIFGGIGRVFGGTSPTGSDGRPVPGNFLGGGIDGFGNMLGSYGNQASSYLGLGNVFGSAPSYGPVVTSGVQAGITEAGGPLVSGGGSGLLGNLGGIGIGMGVGSLVNKAAGGNSLGGTIGGVVGGIAGSVVFGPVGGFVGSALGSLIGGLFGPKHTFRGGDVYYGIDENGKLAALNAMGKRWDSGGAMAEVQGGLDGINSRFDQLGIRFDTGANSAASGNGFRAGNYIGVVGYGESPNQQKDQEKRIVEALQKWGTSDNKNIETVLRRGNRSEDEKSIQSILDDAGFVKNTYEVLLRDFREPMSEWGRQVDAITGPMDAAIQNARKLGLATEDLTASREREFAKLVEQRNASLKGLTDGFAMRSLRASGGSGFAIDTATLDQNAATEVRNLKQQMEQLGATAAETAQFVGQLTAAQNQERAALVQRYTDTIAALANPLSAFGTAMAAIETKFNAAIASAESMGRATKDLMAARDAERDATIAQRNATLNGIGNNLVLRSMRATGADAQSIDLTAFDIGAAAEIVTLTTQLQGLGATAAETAEFVGRLERTQGEERLAIQKQYADAAVEAEKQRTESLLQQTGQFLSTIIRQGQSVRDFIDKQNSTAASGASPTDQLIAARAAFDRDDALARGNDTDALGRITGSASTLLDAARQNFASSDVFQSIRADTLARLGALPATRAADALGDAKLDPNYETLGRAITAMGGTLSSALGDSFAGLRLALTDVLGSPLADSLSGALSTALGDPLTSTVGATLTTIGGALTATVDTSTTALGGELAGSLAGISGTLGGAVTTLGDRLTTALNAGAEGRLDGTLREGFGSTNAWLERWIVDGNSYARQEFGLTGTSIALQERALGDNNSYARQIVERLDRMQASLDRGLNQVLIYQERSIVDQDSYARQTVGELRTVSDGVASLATEFRLRSRATALAVPDYSNFSA